MKFRIGHRYNFILSNNGCLIRWKKEICSSFHQLDYATKKIGEPFEFELSRMENKFSETKFKAKFYMFENGKIQRWCKLYPVTFQVNAEEGTGKMMFGDAYDGFEVPFELIRYPYLFNK